jgi:hypothetical protein
MPHAALVSDSPEQSPRAAAPIGDVAPLNESFEITISQASGLWLGGMAVTGRKPNRLAPSRVRLSEDGQWLIRRNWPGNGLRGIEDVPVVAQAEFERLQAAGVNVVSRGMAISFASASVLTVSPWLPDLERCQDGVFEDELSPKVQEYRRTTEPGSPVLKDVYRASQYSYAPQLGEHALHDVDPYIRWAA